MLSTISNISDDAPVSHPWEDAARQEEAAAAQQEEIATAAKPPNIPTIPEMIVAALMDAGNKGAPGLEPRAMTEFIAARWWPGVPSVAVSPIAWRMWKRGQIEKEGTIYKLANQFIPRSSTPVFFQVPVNKETAGT